MDYIKALGQILDTQKTMTETQSLMLDRIEKLEHLVNVADKQIEYLTDELTKNK